MEKFLLFLMLCLCLGAINFLTDVFIFSDDTFFKSFEDQLSVNRITELILMRNEWSWLGYLFIPLIYVIKLTAVSICLSIGVFLLKLSTPLKSLFKIALFAEFVFLFPPMIKLYWFSFVNLNYTLSDFQFFSPFSVINIFDKVDVEPWLVYPLQLLNLFELLYWFTLAYKIKDLLNRDFAGSLGFVASTYGVGLLLWVILVMFLTVNLT